jgi:hypothetical protein
MEAARVGGPEPFMQCESPVLAHFVSSPQRSDASAFRENPTLSLRTCRKPVGGICPAGMTQTGHSCSRSKERFPESAALLQE